MVDIDHIHLYRDSSNPKLNVRDIESGIKRILPGLTTDIRDSFVRHWMIGDFDQRCESSAISDTYQPFEKQPRAPNAHARLYDGFVLQNQLGLSIVGEERDISDLHIIMTDLLTCTFDENDWRYHARTVICGTPSIVSLSGIVEGPAKPREYYFFQRPGLDPELLGMEFAGKFIAYDDDRLTAAALGCALQAFMYFLTGGVPFCENQECRMYNAHWQVDLIRTQIEKPSFCQAHQEVLDDFNKKRNKVQSFVDE